MSNQAYRENYAILSSVTLAWTGISSSMIFISLFLLQIKHVPLSEVGIIYLFSGGMDIAGQLVGGRLSDRFGTKTIAIAGLSAAVILFSLLTISVLNAWPVTVYFIFYPLLSFFYDVSQVPIASYVSDRQKDQMSNGLSLIYMGGNLGFTLGPVTAGLLVQYVNYYSLFIFGAATAAVAELIIIIGIKANPRYALRPKSIRGGIPVSSRVERGLYPLLILVALSFIAIGFQAIPLSVYESTFLSLSSVEIGLVMSTNGLIITLFQLPVSRLISIHKNLRLLPVTIGTLVISCGFLLISRATGLMLLEVAIALTTLGEMMISVPTNVVVTLFSKSINRGKYQGYYNAFTRAGASASFYLGPLMFSFFALDPANVWYIIAALSAVTGMGYLAYSGQLARQYQKLISSDSG